MLKAIVVSIHGVRGKREKVSGNVKGVHDVSFKLIPSEDAYECR